MEECTDGTWKVFLLPCRFGFCLHFATGWQPAFRYAISLAFVCARNEICLELKTPGMTCRPEMTIWSLIRFSLHGSWMVLLNATWINTEQKFLQIFNARFVAYQLIYPYLFVVVSCVWDVRLYHCCYFIVLKLLKFDCCPPQKWKRKGKKNNHPDLQNLQTVSTESNYFPAWWSQIINQNLLLCMCIQRIRSGISMTE